MSHSLRSRPPNELLTKLGPWPVSALTKHIAAVQRLIDPKSMSLTPFVLVVPPPSSSLRSTSSLGITVTSFPYKIQFFLIQKNFQLFAKTFSVVLYPLHGSSIQRVPSRPTVSRKLHTRRVTQSQYVPSPYEFSLVCTMGQALLLSHTHTGFNQKK